MQQIEYTVVDAYSRVLLEHLVNDRLQEGWNLIGGVSVAVEVTDRPDRKALYFYTQAMTLITGEPMVQFSVTGKVEDSTEENNGI